MTLSPNPYDLIFSNYDADTGEIYPEETIVLHVGDTVSIDYQVINLDDTTQRADGTLTCPVTALANAAYANEDGESVWEYDDTELHENYIEVEEDGHIVYFNVGLEDHNNRQHNISFKIVGLRVTDNQGNTTTYDIVSN